MTNAIIEKVENEILKRRFDLLRYFMMYLLINFVINKGFLPLVFMVGKFPNVLGHSCTMKEYEMEKYIVGGTGRDIDSTVERILNSFHR